MGTGGFGSYFQGLVQQELAQAQAAPPTPAERGMQLLAAGDPAGARPLLEAALADVEATPEVVLALANLLVDAREPYSAIAALRKGVDLVPVSAQPQLWLPLGELLQEQGRHAEAEATYKLVLKRKKDHPDALLKLGILFYEGGCPDDAEAWLRQLVAIDRGALVARQYLALVYMDREDWRQAAAQLHWLRQIDPASDEAPQLQATMFERQGDPLSALGELEALAERGRASAAVHWRIGRLHMGFKNREGALAAFLACAIRDPSRIDAMLYAGKLLESLDRVDEALATYGKILERDPANADAAMFAGRIWEARNGWEQAIALYARAMESDTWRDQATTAHDRLTTLMARIAAAMAGDPPAEA